MSWPEWHPLHKARYCPWCSAAAFGCEHEPIVEAFAETLREDYFPIPGQAVNYLNAKGVDWSQGAFIEVSMSLSGWAKDRAHYVIDRNYRIMMGCIYGLMVILVAVCVILPVLRAWSS